MATFTPKEPGSRSSHHFLQARTTIKTKLQRIKKWKQSNLQWHISTMKNLFLTQWIYLMELKFWHKSWKFSSNQDIIMLHRGLFHNSVRVILEIEAQCISWQIRRNMDSTRSTVYKDLTLSLLQITSSNSPDERASQEWQLPLCGMWYLHMWISLDFLH